MKSGYKILWTDHALSELQKIIEYLEHNWTEKELKTFAHALRSYSGIDFKKSQPFSNFKRKT